MTVSFQIAYDGENGGHAMDVQLLAPALLAFGELVRETNATVNQKKSQVRLLVKSDFEHKCFNIDFQLVQTLIDQITGFLKRDEVNTAKTILEWLGILGVTESGAMGLYGYLKWLRGRKVTSTTEIKDEDKRGMVSVQVGEGATVDKIEIHNTVYALGSNPKVLAAAMKSLLPVGTDGYDRIEFKKNDERLAVIDKEGAKEIALTCAAAVGGIDDEVPPQTVVAHLRVLGPVFDEGAENWRFWYGDEAIYVDISETDIAKRALERGGSLINDTYKVQMQIEEHKTPTGRFKNHYKIIEVIDFLPSPVQGDLFPQLEDKTK